MQKAALKRIKYSKNETILNIDKNGLHRWAIAFCKSISLGQKIKLHKIHQKRLYNHITVYSMKKTAWKKIKYSKSATIFNIDKNGLNPWVIAFAKSSVLGQKIKLHKTHQKWLYNHITVILCKKPLKKRSNIRKVRPF